MNFGMTKSSNHVSAMSQSLVLNEQEAVLLQCEVVVFMRLLFLVLFPEGKD